MPTVVHAAELPENTLHGIYRPLVVYHREEVESMDLLSIDWEAACGANTTN